MVKYTSKLLEISLRLHPDVVNGPYLMSIGQLINPFCSLCPTTRYISALVAKLAGGTGCYEAYSQNFTCFETCCSNRKESPPIGITVILLAESEFSQHWIAMYGVVALGMCFCVWQKAFAEDLAGARVAYTD